LHIVIVHCYLAVHYISVVSVKTQIVNPPQTMSAIKGATVDVPCGVISDREIDVTWRWFVDDIEVHSGDPRFTVGQDGTLHISSVRNTDIGVYTCFVLSEGGNDTATADITVIGKL
jgi:protein sidekick